MKKHIREIIDVYVDKKYCKGCIFLRDTDMYNHYGDDISSCKYDFVPGYYCMFYLTPGTFQLGYCKSKELYEKGLLLERSTRCILNSTRTTTIIEKIIKDMDLAIIFSEGLRNKETVEKIDKYLKDMIALINKILGAI